MSAALAAGFLHPVFGSQAVFRAALDALSRPGLPVALPIVLSPPAPLTPELAAIALAFADSDAPLWLDEPLAQAGEVASFLRFHTGARIVTEPSEAAFALVSDPTGTPGAGTFAQGSDLYPDRSTTLVLAVDSFDGGEAMVFSGPGIRGTVTMRATGLPIDFPAQVRANRALFPRGVDWLLVASGAVLGLPRSARLENG